MRNAPRPKRKLNSFRSENISAMSAIKEKKSPVWTSNVNRSPYRRLLKKNQTESRMSSNGLVRRTNGQNSSPRPTSRTKAMLKKRTVLTKMLFLSSMQMVIPGKVRFRSILAMDQGYDH